ncbi:MAG: hypothetical protein IKT22_00505 [Prevotella sp.]|nr:hypothetical protein [Prevotella sp.]MBR6493740.1 hypothetical protein [Prevotella sp.]
MKTNEYKERCVGLLDEFHRIIEAGKTDRSGLKYEGMDGLLREFRHLVYAFDKNLPLNDELNENTLRIFPPYMGDNEGDIERIQGYMNFFIHYLDDYAYF